MLAYRSYSLFELILKNMYCNDKILPTFLLCANYFIFASLQCGGILHTLKMHGLAPTTCRKLPLIWFETYGIITFGFWDHSEDNRNFENLYTVVQWGQWPDIIGYLPPLPSDVAAFENAELGTYDNCLQPSDIYILPMYLVTRSCCPIKIWVSMGQL